MGRARITSIDWTTCGSLFLSADVPKIKTVLIQRADVEAMGAGETAVTAAAAAVANAIFDATGARILQSRLQPGG